MERNTHASILHRRRETRKRVHCWIVGTIGTLVIQLRAKLHNQRGKKASGRAETEQPHQAKDDTSE